MPKLHLLVPLGSADTVSPAERCPLSRYGWRRLEFERLSPIDAIPTAVNLTNYSGGEEDFIATLLKQIVNAVQPGSFVPPIGKVFTINQIVEAHCDGGQ